MDPRRFSCWLVGQGALLAACGELLLRRHRVTAVVTGDGPARQWATGAGVPCFDSIAAVTAPAPDYLFSIINHRVMRPAELKTARRLAVNFHSSPLPKYAGVHQTSWAILHGESEYGVTWHVMTDEVDAGDILVQRRFPVAPDETTLSLSVKCYDHGLAAFEELLAALEEGEPTRRAQDPAQRTYFTLRDRMPAAGLVDWRRPAVEIERMCRTAEMGVLDNSFGAPKILAADDLVVLSRAAVLSAVGDGEPGLVLPSDDPDSVRVRTGDGDLLVLGLRRPEGEPVSPRAWAARAAADSRLPLLAPDWLTRADHLSRRHCRNEEHWVAQLRRALPSWLPMHPSGRPGPVHHHTLRLPDTMPRPAEAAAVEVAARWLRHAAAFGQARQTVWWSDEKLRAEVGPLGRVYAAAVPVTVDVVDGWGRTDLETAVATATSRGTFLWDLPARYPELTCGWAGPAVRFGTGADQDPAPGDLTLTVDPDGDRITVAAGDDGLCFAAAQLVTGLLAAA